MSLPPTNTGRVAQCLRVLRFARVDLADGRMAFLYIHHGAVAVDDELSGPALGLRGTGTAHNLTRDEPLTIEVVRVLNRGTVPELADSLLQMG